MEETKTNRDPAESDFGGRPPPAGPHLLRIRSRERLADTPLPYHEDAIAMIQKLHRGGYLGFLTPVQERALMTLQSRVVQDPEITEEALAEAQGSQHMSQFLLRWLRARDFKMEAAFAMLKAHIEWRRSVDIVALRNMTEEEVLGCSPAEVLEVVPHFVAGFDRQHRPYVIHQYANLSMAALLRLTTQEKMIQHHVWEQEKITDLLALQMHRTGFAVEAWCTVLDLKGMRLRQVNPAFFSLLGAFSAIDQNHYPERAGAIHILNAPSVFPYVWSGIKPLLSAATTSKIQIYSGRRWMEALERELGPAQLIPDYGGTNLSLSLKDGVGSSPVFAGLTRQLEADGQYSAFHPQGSPSRRLEPQQGDVGLRPPRSAESRTTRRFFADDVSLADLPDDEGLRLSPSNKPSSRESSPYFSASSGKDEESASDEETAPDGELDPTADPPRFFRTGPGVCMSSDTGESDSDVRLPRRRERRTPEEEQKRRRRRRRRRRQDLRRDDGRGPPMEPTREEAEEEEPFSAGDRATSARGGLKVQRSGRRRRRWDRDRRQDRGRPRLPGEESFMRWRRPAPPEGSMTGKIFSSAWFSPFDSIVTVVWVIVLRLPWTNRLLHKPFASLSKLHYWLNAVSITLATVTVLIAAYWISSLFWTSALTEAALWSSVTLFLLGTVKIVLNSMAISALHTRSLGVLVFVLTVNFIFMLLTELFLVVISLIFLFQRSFLEPQVDRVSSEQDQSQAYRSLRYYSMILLIVAFLGSLLTIGEILVEVVLIWRMKMSCCDLSFVHRRGFTMNPDSSVSLAPGVSQTESCRTLDAVAEEPPSYADIAVETEAEFRKILQVSSQITISFAALSIVVSALLLSQSLRFVDTLPFIAFSHYGMLLLGVSTVLSGLLGLDCIDPKRAAPVDLHEKLCLLSAFILTFLAIRNFIYGSQVDDKVSRHWEDLGYSEDDDEEDESSVAVLFLSWLTTTGILELIIGFFQLACTFATRGLKKVLRDKGELRNLWTGMKAPDQVMVIWAVISGLAFAIFEGTHAVFSENLNRTDGYLSLYARLGDVDARYWNPSAALVVSEGIAAIFAGPGTLIFAWAVYTQRSFRYLLGVLVFTLQLHFELSYYLVEAYRGFRHLSLSQRRDLFVGVVILLHGLRALLALVCLVYCLVLGIYRAEAQERVENRIERLERKSTSRSGSRELTLGSLGGKEGLPERLSTIRSWDVDMNDRDNPAFKWYFDVKAEVDQYYRWWNLQKSQQKDHEAEEAVVVAAAAAAATTAAERTGAEEESRWVGDRQRDRIRTRLAEWGRGRAPAKSATVALGEVELLTTAEPQLPPELQRNTSGQSEFKNDSEVDPVEFLGRNHHEHESGWTAQDDQVAITVDGASL